MEQKKNQLNIESIARVTGLVTIDVALLAVAFVIATFMHGMVREEAYRFPFFVNDVQAFGYLQIVLYFACYIVCFAVFRMYRNIWASSGVGENFFILAGVALGTGLCLFVNFFYGNQYKFSICIAGMLLLPMLFVERYSIRIIRRLRREFLSRNHSGKSPILIVGAGFFGTYVQAQIATGVDKGDNYVAAFVDDDPAKQGTRINGIRVRGTTKDIPEIVDALGIREIIIAIPSATDQRIADLVALSKSTKCRVRMVTPLRDLDAQPTMRDIREISIDDILFRPEVELDKVSIAAYIQHKVVLVTGGGGSIGSEICRQAAMFYPEKLIIFDIYENSAYELQCEFRRSRPYLNVEVRIGSVRDKARVDIVMEEFHPDLVIHTAAHKHVPLMEDSPAEAVKNNIVGTRNVLLSASEHGVTRFVQLSTDKAVNPTNVMGASKRITELIVQEFARHDKMKCMTVRFGNVLGSRGSVIPLFEQQIKNGGPVQITDPNITRYFMSIPEASQLVLQAGALGESGAIYVLNMGEPVRILDLAEKMIRFHGYTPNVTMPIEIIGLRPGEKMYEELTMDSEEQTMEETTHDRIMLARPVLEDDPAFPDNLALLVSAAAENDNDAVLRQLHAIVPNFQHVD